MALLAEYVPTSRAQLTERYLYPQIKRTRAVLGRLTPSDAAEADQPKIAVEIRSVRLIYRTKLR